MCTILILNSCTLVDNNRYDDNFICYIDVINEFEEMIYKLDPTHVLFGGETKTDIIRSSSNAVVLRTFINDCSMVTCIDINIAYVLYTFISPYSESKLDHVFPSLKWNSVLCRTISLIIIYILTIYHALCVNIDVNHTTRSGHADTC